MSLMIEEELARMDRAQLVAAALLLNEGTIPEIVEHALTSNSVAAQVFEPAQEKPIEEQATADPAVEVEVGRQDSSQSPSWRSRTPDGTDRVDVGDQGERDNSETQLTARERDVLVRIVGGQGIATIASELHLSKRTVDNHINRLRAKLAHSEPAASKRVGTEATQPSPTKLTTNKPLGVVEAMRLAGKVGSPRAVISASLQLGSFLEERGRFDEAKTVYEQVIALSRQLEVGSYYEQAAERLGELRQPEILSRSVDQDRLGDGLGVGITF